MTIRACYEAFDGDYESAVGRLVNEKLVRRFLYKFLDDPSFSLLKDSLAEGNTQEAFRAAHTLKGVCQNLSFTRLGHSSSEMTEALRAEKAEEYAALFERVAHDYEETVTAIRTLQKEEMA